MSDYKKPAKADLMLGISSKKSGVLFQIVPRGSGYVMPRVSVRRAILCLLPLLGILATIALWPSPKKNVAPATEPPTLQQALLLQPTIDQPKSVMMDECFENCCCFIEIKL